MSVRRRAQALLFVVFLLVGLIAVPASSQTGGCSADALKPILVDSMANQGLPYTTLVRGKKAVVRFYLMRPECSKGTQQTIKVTGATLVAKSGNTLLGPQIANPIDSLTSTETAKIPWVQPFVSADPVTQKLAASNTSPSNPRFEILATYLKPASISGPFQATFTLNLTYQFDTKTGLSGSTGTRTNVSFPMATPVSVAGPTASLRILTVPMGNPAAGFTEENLLIGGFGTLANVYPVPDGAGNVGEGGTGGILYAMTPGTMDIRSLMTSGGKLCSSNTNSSTIRALLAAQLNQNNSANDAKLTADRVLGAIDTASSLGDGNGCAEGMAGNGTKEAWVRTLSALDIRGNTVNATGAIMTMEESHNAGAVTPLRSSVTDRTHSPNDEADAGANRAYRLSDNAFLSSDTTAMAWQGISLSNDTRSLLEKHDWEQVFCRLGGPVTTDCAFVASEGTVAGSSAGGHPTQAMVVGLTDGTPEVADDSTTWDPASTGTQIFDGFYGPVPPISPPTAGSEYHFVQRAGTAILSDQLVAVSKVDSNHDHVGDAPGEEPSHLGFFSISYAHKSQADRWELWKGTPGSGTLLATRSKIAAPTVSGPTSHPAPGEPAGEGFDDQTPLSAPVVEGATFNDDARVVADPRAASPPNAVTNLLGSLAEESMTITFDPPAFDVGMKIGNGLAQTTATLEAFDAGGNSIATDEAPVPPDVSGEVEVSSDNGDIASVELTYTRPTGLPIPAEEIDDLHFTPGAGPDLSIVESTATTTGDPRHLRGAFFAQCPIINAGQVLGQHNLPVASALKPVSIEGQTAHFSITWDNGTSCENGGQVALVFRSSDGYTVSEFSSPKSFSVNENAPVAAILSPVIDAAILEHQQLTLSGQAYDATDGVLPGSQLSWYLNGPAFASETLVGTGNSLTLRPPNGFEWPTGDYTVRLVAADFEGNTAEVTSSAEILIDDDNDGISLNDEQCYAGPSDPTPDNNPGNAWSDADGDGYVNVDDDQACVHATRYSVAADFDPDTLFVPSSGNPVQIFVRSHNRDLNQVLGSSVRISDISGAKVEADPSNPRAFDGSAVSWQVVNGVGVAKFDRQKLTAWLAARGMADRFVELKITGQGLSGTVAWTFFGQSTTHAKPGK